MARTSKRLLTICQTGSSLASEVKTFARRPDGHCLRAQGKSPEEVTRFVADAFAKGVFQPPARPGVDYMLSTKNVVPLDPDRGMIGHFPPHVMFYAPHLTNADLGSQNLAWPAFVTGSGTPNALIIVPVREEAQAGPQHEHR